MSRKMLIREDQEWRSFKAVHDLRTDKWALRSTCEICKKQTLGEPIERSGLGQEFQNNLEMPICQRCKNIVATYAKMNKGENKE